MTITEATQLIQVAYPQVYFACHTRHQRKRSTEHRLSARDAAILAHLDERVPLGQARLTAHLGTAKSTVSEALTRLARLGYVTFATAAASDRPAGARRAVLLTSHGAAAIRDTSVLETPRLRAVLAELSDRERRSAAAGLMLLARACRRASERASRRKGV